MSEVISFRLNKENPREAQAYEVLKIWQGQGYSIRQTITEALLRPDEPQTQPVPSETIDEINELLSQVRRMLLETENRDYSSQKVQGAGRHFLGLTDDFVNSVKRAAKPGIRLD
jgi:hypothetical protein